MGGLSRHKKRRISGCVSFRKAAILVGVGASAPANPAEFLPEVCMIIDHVGLSLSDYEASKKFFSKALAPLGISLLIEAQGRSGYGKGGKPGFWFGEGDKQVPMHIAFTADSWEQVRGFYKAALEAGGRDNGAPGVRSKYHPDYYAAFIIGPDGHNIEAVCHAQA
jgi:catechol 2,3-dioxygenase-like lactoylglutathione lyase family enzyme